MSILGFDKPMGKLRFPADGLRISLCANIVRLLDGLAVYGEFLFPQSRDRPGGDLPYGGTFPEVIAEHHQVSGGE
jgi:hypothetical protein